MRDAIAIIPARLSSTRLPGKVLLSESGRPLIQHVYEAACGSKRAGRVVIAGDDQRIIDAARAFGAEAVLTSPSHPNGTSRLAEACDRLGVDDARKVVVNVQGDEPELDPSLIDAAIEALEGSALAHAATIGCPFEPGEDPSDPNIVKVVRRVDGTALYFSRARIPFDRDGTGAGPALLLRHVGLYAYRRDFLRTYLSLSHTPLEECEKLEQLRVLEHGYVIAVGVARPRWTGVGIDTPEQYRAFVQRVRRSGAPGTPADAGSGA